MKSFDDLTDAEMVALTDDQVRYYMDRSCAEAGAPLLPIEPGPEPVEPARGEDVTAYSVAGFVFANLGDAQEIAEAINQRSRCSINYCRDGSYMDRMLVVDRAPVGVITERIFSAAGWDAARDRVLAYNREKERHERDVKEYEKARDKRQEAAGWVQDRIIEASERESNRARYNDELKRYVEIAEGDEAMARRFLLKAHPEASEFIEPLVEEGAA